MRIDRFCVTAFLILAVSGLQTSVFAATADDVGKLSSNDARTRNEGQARLISSGKKSIPALMECLNDASRETRSRCLGTLRTIRLSGSDSIAKFGKKMRKESDEGIRVEAVSVLSASSRLSSIPELKVFAESDPSERARAKAVEHIARHGGRQQESFLRARLLDSSPTVRFRAMEGLARIGDCSGRDPATRAIAESSNLEEREAAIGVIGACARASDIAYLDGLMRARGERHHFKLTASFAKHHIELMQIAESGRLDYLIKTLGDSRQAVRLWAAGELIQMASPQTISALKGILSIPDHVGRSEAALALDDLINGN